ncbi:hypothetical protein O0I10_013266, partial [Lichtheimia ornata]
MRGIGSTKQNMLINEPCNETAAAPTGWHGYTVSIRGNDAILRNTTSGRASFGDTIII